MTSPWNIVLAGKWLQEQQEASNHYNSTLQNKVLLEPEKPESNLPVAYCLGERKSSRGEWEEEPYMMAM